MERFQTMLARRVKREPLQHITGHAPFRYLDLKVGPGVFIPRPETELVVQEGVDWATRSGMYRAKVVDLCAGSGAIGLAFAYGSAGQRGVGRREKRYDRRVDAAQPRRDRETVSRNRRQLSSGNRRRHANADAEANLTAPSTSCSPILRTCRLPTFPNSRKCAIMIPIWRCTAVPRMARSFRSASSHARRNCFKPGGLMVMEHDVTQGERLAAFARTCGFVDVTVHNDYTGRPRYLTAEKQPTRITTYSFAPC